MNFKGSRGDLPVVMVKVFVGGWPAGDGDMGMVGMV